MAPCYTLVYYAVLDSELLQIGPFLTLSILILFTYTVKTILVPEQHIS